MPLFPYWKRLLQAGWTLFVPLLPHSTLTCPPSWSAQPSVSSLLTTLLSLRKPSWRSLHPVIAGWWPFTYFSAISLHQLDLCVLQDSQASAVNGITASDTNSVTSANHILHYRPYSKDLSSSFRLGFLSPTFTVALTLVLLSLTYSDLSAVGLG